MPATLVVSEILSDTLMAFRQQNLPLSYFATDLGSDAAVKGQDIIAHVAKMPVASTYDAAQGGYKYGAQDGKGLLEDVKVTMDQHTHVPIKITHADAITIRNHKYLATINNAAFVLGKAMVDHALSKVVAAQFSESTTETISNTNRDTLGKVTKAMNAKGFAPNGRYGVVNSDFFNALDSDSRIASGDYHGQRRSGDPLGRLYNVGGFAEIMEYPTLPANSENLSAFFFDERAVTVASRLPNNTQELASSLGIPISARVETVQDPETGLALMGLAWVEDGTLDVYITMTLLFGATVGRRGGSAGTGTDYAGHRVVTA